MRCRYTVKKYLSLLFILSFLLVGCHQTSLITSYQEPTKSTTATKMTATTTQSTIEIDDLGIRHENVHYSGKTDIQFELPLCGATGYASYPLSLYESASKDSVSITTLQPGDGFTILEENGSWWRIAYGEYEGYVEYVTCYLNIADVVPSIVIKNTNSTESLFVSSGQTIPSITGEQLYNSLCENARFGDVRHVIAANYCMVKKIYNAQQQALTDGYTLVLYETFRPLDVQRSVSTQLAELRKENSTVRVGIDASPWGIAWFIANNISTHQLGAAMDVSLAKISTITWRKCGEYLYRQITGYELCQMPTDMHELSVAAVSMEQPVNSSSPTAWKNIKPAPSMTDAALRLRDYCTNAGLSPLASEWWHFNDLETKVAIGNMFVSDVFYINSCYSKIPQ